MQYEYILEQIQLLDQKTQQLIDVIKDERQVAKGNDKQLLSYLSKKVDSAGKSFGLALDRIEEFPINSS